MTLSLQKTIILALLLMLGLTSAMLGQAGDTLVVETFKFSDPAPPGVYRGTFEFPSDTAQFQKILMSYTLKCDASTRADGLPCGEWDYLTYTYVVDSAGVMDSTYKSRFSHTYIAGNTADTLDVSLLPTWTRISDWQYAVTRGNILTLDSALFDTGNTASDKVLAGANPTHRSQYLWRASELSTANLNAGLLTGLRLDISTMPSQIRNLRIRIKHTMQDSLLLQNMENTGFTEVYRHHQAANTGWTNFDFPAGFVWDGTSNLLVEFLYDQYQNGQTADVTTDSISWSAGITADADDHYLDFSGSRDILNAGATVQQRIQGSQSRTIEAWVYARKFDGGGVFQAGASGTARDFSLRTLGSADQWRVQQWGAPDFDVTLPSSKDSWHHIAVTHDGNTSRLYYDGQFIASEPSNLNTGSTDLLIGIWQGRRFNGNIDEFRVWDTDLSAATIQSWMGKSVNASHPDFGNLIAYYPMDEGSGVVAVDASGNGYDAQLLGVPAWQQLPAEALRLDLNETAWRPNIIFEQGTFASSQLDSVRTTDSVQNAPFQLVIYGNPANNRLIRHDAPNQPDVATDTALYWEGDRYFYTYDLAGNLIDSTWQAKGNSLYRVRKEWYSNIVRYEIGRYITPYGINLDLGPDGTEWFFDVTDYAPLFRNHVYIQAGNNQELLNLKFLMIKGTPPRDVKRVQNIYDGAWNFTDFVNNTRAEPKSIQLDPNASMYRIKTRTSGHNFGGPTNCAEFCRREHSVWVDGSKEFAWWLWNECSTNPLQPQGGTWIYDRAGWCPGDIVETYNHELTPLVSPGASVILDYEVDPLGRNPEGRWDLRTQLVSYGAPNHRYDVAIQDIVAPSDKHIHGRWNPMCGKPKIIIQNRGSETLTSALITYGVKDGIKDCYYRWEGNLEFMESAEVELPLFNWTGANQSTSPAFHAETSEPNHQVDEYPSNNRLQHPFLIPASHFGKFIVELRTNRVGAAQNKWRIYDDQGNVVKSLLFPANSRTHIDTVDLPNGCYELVLTDAGSDGLNFFVNRAQVGTGWFRLRLPNGNLLKSFNPDFGSEIRYAFTVDYSLGDEFFNIACDRNVAIKSPQSLASKLELYPNPASDKFFLDTKFEQPTSIEISILDGMGRMLKQQSYAELMSRTLVIDAPYAPGTYFVRIKAKDGATYTYSLVLVK